MSHADLQMEHIKDVAATSFDYFVLFWWEGKESLLRDIQDKGRAAACTELTPISGFAKLQSFRETALHTAGYCWAWIDMCFIDRTNNAELQQLVNFMMFIWYRHSAPTIVYLSDVLPSSEPDS